MGAIVAVDQNRPAQEAVERGAALLADGGVLVMPTDSVYGIGCAALAGNPALRRIFSIKRRDRAQTLPWLVADAADLEVYGACVPAWAQRAAKALWPGALTLVVQASPEVPPEYRRPAAPGGRPTIALRCPGSNLVRELARKVGVPLPTTSANTHGLAAATSGAGLEPRIVEAADLTFDAGPAPIAVASAIVDCTAGEPRVLRRGSVSPEEFLRAAGLSPEPGA